MDPLRQDRIGKSQAESSFALPKLVSFDLWGTLYAPIKPVPEQHYDISHGEFGISKLVLSITTEFPQIFSSLSKEFPNYGKYSGHIHSSDNWWLELVARLYKIPRTDAKTQKLFERLMAHFESAEAYVLYEDVKPVLDTLRANNIPIVAASNSDDRVYKILENLGISQYFSDADIHLSYDVGHAKPDRKFFASYLDKYYQQSKKVDPSITMTTFLEGVWHVGDDYDRDFVGSVKAGCNGVFLDRLLESVFLCNQPTKKVVSNDCFESQCGNSVEGDDLIMLANNRVCVNGLQPLLRLFNL